MSAPRIILRSRRQRPAPIRPVARARTEKPYVSDYQEGLILDRDQVGQLLESYEWKFAKTMPQWPHWYVTKDGWQGPLPWDNIAQFIRENGYKGWFGKRKTPRRYWEFNGRLYWGLGPTTTQITVINRCPDEPADYYHVERT